MLSTRLLLVVLLASATLPAQPRVRARDAGILLGTMPAGPLNAITDVPGVRVGHATLRRDNRVCTGVTAILPHDGNLFREKVPAAVFTGNGFGKFIGTTQIDELGELETPILLTSTLNVWRVADALTSWMLALPGNENVRSINPVVAETNDGALNDIRSRPVGPEDVFAALKSARSGPVPEGAVGAGTGTIAFGWKGGIGTASRVTLAGHTVGVLVQTNYGGDLMIAGVPVNRKLRQSSPGSGDGSVIVVIATDAPLDARNLKRLAARAMLGLGRTGASGSNGSGDYALAFSTLRAHPQPTSNDATSPLFLAAIEATEEAVINSLFMAETTESNGRRVEALPLQRVLPLLKQ
jgi:D-aminopeptidase